MDQLLKLPFMKSALAIKAGIQMNKTVLSLMTQMRNITTAAMFATANGHVGSGASVADNFRILFDDLIGKILQVVDEKNLHDNTQIFYLSDHGDNIGERDFWGKSNFYEESVGVPCIIKGPSIPAGKVTSGDLRRVGGDPWIRQNAKTHTLYSRN